jgi:phytoene synthase
LSRFSVARVCVQPRPGAATHEHHSDIKADFEQGRVYLPQEDLARFGVSERALSSGVMTDAIRKLLAHECQRARQFYTTAAQAMPHAESRKLVAAEIMGAIYFEILQRIERRGYDVFTERIRVPKLQRARIALQIWALSQLSAFGLTRSARA